MSISKTAPFHIKMYNDSPMFPYFSGTVHKRDPSGLYKRAYTDLQ